MINFLSQHKTTVFPNANTRPDAQVPKNHYTPNFPLPKKPNNTPSQ